METTYTSTRYNKYKRYGEYVYISYVDYSKVYTEAGIDIESPCDETKEECPKKIVLSEYEIKLIKE